MYNSKKLSSFFLNFVLTMGYTLRFQEAKALVPDFFATGCSLFFRFFFFGHSCLQRFNLSLKILLQIIIE